jgi:hypothetical protein
LSHYCSTLLLFRLYCFSTCFKYQWHHLKFPPTSWWTKNVYKHPILNSCM